MRELIDLADIKITLKYGFFNGESRKKIFWAYIPLVFFALFGIALGITMATIQYINKPEPILSVVGTLITIILGISLAPIVGYLLLHRNERIRKEIEKWVEDAILVDAYIRELDRKPGIIYTLIKFQVEFNIEGIPYIRSSEQEEQMPGSYKSLKGYFADMSKYINRNVKILYSPKYDQVMILKK